MPAKEILLLGNPLLRTGCEPVRSFDPDELRVLIGDLRDTLGAFHDQHGFGRGIASPQIGVTRRVIYLQVEKPLPMINPVIVRRSRTMMTLWDDCFSFPDLLAKVKRNLTVEVRYQDPEGKRHLLSATGPMSELLQHEIDHINGILAVDRAIDARHIVYRSQYERWFGTKERMTL